MRLTLNSGLIGGDGGTLDSHIVFLSCQSWINGDLVLRLVSVRQTQVKILQLNVHVRQDELQKMSMCYLSVLMSVTPSIVIKGYSISRECRTESQKSHSRVSALFDLMYLLFDELPNDASHLISIHLHHRLVHLDPLCSIWNMYINFKCYSQDEHTGNGKGQSLHTVKSLIYLAGG